MSLKKNHITYRILEKEFETPLAASFRLQPEEPVTYRPGQFITLLFDGLSVRQVRRSYSISSTPGVDKLLRITVQKIPNGLVSRHLVDHVKPGDVLTGLRPKGKFTLPDRKIKANEPVVLIGGGSGFTPLFSILQELLFHHPESQVVVVLANSTPEQVFYRETLFRHISAFPERLKVRFVISMTTADFKTLCSGFSNVFMHAGRITNALIEQWVKNDCATEPFTSPLFYVCGPVGLKLKAIPVLRMMGYPGARIFEEDFIIKEPFRPDAAAFHDSRLTLAFHGKIHHLTVPAGKTVLEAALENNIELPYNCRSGICTTCTGTCTSGKAVMYGQDAVTDTEMTNGDVLTCVAFPVSEEITIEVPG